MRKHYVILFLALLVINQISGQEDEVIRNVSFKTVLEPVLQLNVDPSLEVEFGIVEINDDLYQVTKYPDDVMFSVDATTNWTLAINTSDQYFSGVNNPTLKIPVNFVGYHIENYGTNWDNGSYSNIINKTKDTILELSEDRKMILVNGRRNNIGGGEMNSFILRWKLMPENDALKLKNYAHMFMMEEHFTVNVQLTLQETLCSNCE
jgi:hypothetical protein